LLTALVEKKPQSKGPYLQIAQIYLDENRKEEAIRWFEKYLEIDPSDRFIRQRIRAMRGEPDAVKAPSRMPPVDQKVIRREQERWKKGFFILAAVVGLVVIFAVVKLTLFPSTRCIAAVNANSINPSWSPKGDRIAFVKTTDAGASYLTLYNVKTGKTRDLIPLKNAWMAELRWSPDGTEIAYEAQAAEDNYWGPAIYSVRVSDGNIRKVAEGSDPTWAPDSMRMAFVAPPKIDYSRWSSSQSEGGGEGVIPAPEDKKKNRVGEQGNEICVLDLMNGDVKKVTAFPGARPTWSPKGEEILFQYEEPIDWEKKMAERRARSGEGSESAGSAPDMTEMMERALASGGATNIQADRGMAREFENMMYEKQNAESSIQDSLNPTDLYVVKSDGTELTRLTEGGLSASPRWEVDGDRILYTYYPPGKKNQGEIWVMNKDGSAKTRILGEGVSVSDNRTVTMLPQNEGFLFEGWTTDSPAVISLFTLGSTSDLFWLKAPGGKPKRLENKHPYKQNFSVSPDGKDVAYQVLNKGRKFEVWRMKINSIL
jgi:Tol biopolymer transport system component